MILRTDSKYASPQSHLIHLLVQMKDHQPAFTLFLGAGASIRSGVKSATTLVNEWREKYSLIHGESDTNATKKRDQPDEYSFLFEALFDHPSQRRNFIETCITNASPSWGYLYLVNLIHANVFNTVFTTNFDDLLNEACFTYSSSVRPVVCAHDSSITNVRIYSARPKIIKLHGDFLFDSIKNTERETFALENNMREKFGQYANEFGMIVIGYAGNDRSVMDPLEKLLESDKAFPHGLYWCIRKGTVLSRYVERLLRFSRFRLIEIEGFDEFCADLHNATGLSMQPEVADPYGALTQKLDGLMRKLNLGDTDASHPVIERDVARLAEQLVSLAISENVRGELVPVSDDGVSPLALGVSNIPLPYVFLATFFLRRGEIRLSQLAAYAALRKEPSENAFRVAFKSLRLRWDEKFATFLIDLLEKSIANLDEPTCDITDFALELMNAKRFDEAEKLLNLCDVVRSPWNLFNQAISDLNHAQIYMHLGKPVPNDLLVRAHEIVDDPSMQLATRMGAAIILQDWVHAEQYLEVVLRTAPWEGALIPTWPIAELLLPNLTCDSIRGTLVEIRNNHLSGIGIPHTQAISQIQRVLA